MSAPDDTDTDPEIEQSTAERFDEFYRSYYQDEIATLAQHYPNEQRALTISWPDLNRYDPDLADDYRNYPDQIQPHASRALTQFDLPYDIDLSDAEIRLIDLPESSVHYVGEYSPSELVGGLAGIIGQVTKRTQTQPIMTTCAFECLRCGVITRIPQQTNTTEEPHNCSGCDRSGPFREDTDRSEFEDFQQIQLQVPPERSMGSNATFDLNLRNDLCDTVEPGDRVVANSRVHLTRKNSNRDAAPIYTAYGEGMSAQPTDGTMDDIDPEDYMDVITTIAESGRHMEALTNSFAPSHYGDEMIKQALVLQLFGGVTATKPGGDLKRGTPHIFLIGDPGCDKTGMLQYASKLEPRSIYTVGMTTSQAGLTAAAVQDDFGDGGWSLEAGAVVEAHKGLASIDELDKMRSEDQDGLNEAMSEQTVSVSKAGINATLPAETKILAAANPEYGRFDEYQPLGEQIDIAPALLSRFDLIFTLTDQPDEEFDRELAGMMNDTAQAAQRAARGEEIPADAAGTPELPPEVIRAYVAHARTIIPVFTEEAKELIQEEYANIRMANSGDDGGAVPTTARDVDAMHRLSEAAARTRLSEEIEEEDVAVALNIRRACLANIGVDPETGEFDTDIVETGQSMTQRQRVKSVKELIREMQEEFVDEPGAPREELLERAVENGMDQGSVEHELQKLRDKGEVYSPRNDFLRTS